MTSAINGQYVKPGTESRETFRGSGRMATAGSTEAARFLGLEFQISHLMQRGLVGFAHSSLREGNNWFETGRLGTMGRLFASLGSDELSWRGSERDHPPNSMGEES